MNKNKIAIATALAALLAVSIVHAQSTSDNSGGSNSCKTHNGCKGNASCSGSNGCSGSSKSGN